MAFQLPLFAKNLRGTPAPNPALKIEWHSFSTPFEGAHTLFITPITKLVEIKPLKPGNICDYI